MYKRETELRKLEPNDTFKLGVILDDNHCWKKLMEIIPKQQQCSSATDQMEIKYNNDHIRLIENAAQRHGESRLFSQILFDEWSTSGRKHERPTVGTLLQLLVKAQLFRAADFVAINFLNEEPPQRPENGPAARIDISLSDDIFNDIEDYTNDSSYYPGTETINDNAKYANSTSDINKDFYTKYQRTDKPMDTISEEINILPPKAPPRPLRRSRLQQELQQNQPEPLDQEMTLENKSSFMSQNIAKVFELMTNDGNASFSNDVNNLMHSQNTESTTLSEAPIPMISILADNSTETKKKSNKFENTSAEITLFPKESSSNSTTLTTNSTFLTDSEILPNISELNLDGEQDIDKEVPLQPSTVILSTLPNQNENNCLSNGSSIDDDIELPIDIITNVNDDDDNDDDDNSIPNLSIFGQLDRSNNDSSLTTVTGTSGENSFEMSINDELQSNENIPCLSALKQ